MIFNTFHKLDVIKGAITVIKVKGFFSMIYNNTIVSHLFQQKRIEIEYFHLDSCEMDPQTKLLTSSSTIGDIVGTIFLFLHTLFLLFLTCRTFFKRLHDYLQCLV